MNKHYIRLEKGTNIIKKGFSDAFEKPQDGDICINKEGGRHFTIENQQNPCMVHSDNCPRFIWQKENGIIETDQTWRDTWIKNNTEPKPNPNLTDKERLDRIELIILKENGVI